MSDTWTFEPPTRTWITVTDAEIVAGASVTPLLRAFYNNADFIRQGVLGRTKTSVVSVPHTHDGVDTPQVETGATGRNLITNSAPDAKYVGDWSGTGDWWPRVKYKKKKPPHVHVVPGRGFNFTGRKNAHVWTIPTTRADVSKMIWGQGSEITCSLYARVLSTATQGELSFGMSTTNGWLEGCRFAVDYTDLSTSHARFYGFATVSPVLTEGTAYPTNSDTEINQLNGPRFEVRITESFDAALEVTGFMLSLGHRLRWWVPARMDAHGNGNTHDDWNLYGMEVCPAWEKSVAFTNATKLVGV